MTRMTYPAVVEAFDGVAQCIILRGSFVGSCSDIAGPQTFARLEHGQVAAQLLDLGSPI